MPKTNPTKPTLYTVLSPSLLPLYDLSESIVVIIDILRATSTIATAVHHGAKCVIPVRSVQECIAISTELNAIAAGERDGKIAQGLQYGNSPFTFPRHFVADQCVVLTTTNGTRLLHEALAANAGEIITGAFSNFSSVCRLLASKNKNVVLACAAWKNRINLEDTLFAGAVVHTLKENFTINCDASMIAETLYVAGRSDLFDFMRKNNASHYNRLMGFGLEKDLRYCLEKDTADTLVIYHDGKLVAARDEL